MAEPDEDRPYFGRARIAAGLALVGLSIVLTLVDAFSETYSVEPILLGLILGSGLGSLGVAAGAKLLGGR